MIEITTYRLLNGVDHATFREADAALQSDFFYQLSGLVRRTTACADDGTWLAVTVWNDDAAADESREWMMPSSGFAASTMIDPATITTKRFVAS
jgi:hypothetical protein